MDEIKEKLIGLKERFELIVKKLDLSGKKEKAQKLENESLAQNFWDNPETAQKKMKELSSLKEEIDQVENLGKGINDMFQLSLVSESQDLLEDLKKEVKILEDKLGTLEIKNFLSGKYDYFDAILSGKKTIEGRVPDYSKSEKDYRSMNPGDKIKFICLETKRELTKEVSILKHFNSAKQFLETLGLEKTLPGIKNLEQGINTYHSFPGYEERIKNNGIYAIFLK